MAYKRSEPLGIGKGGHSGAAEELLSQPWRENTHNAYSGDVNSVFQRDVDSRSGDVNKVGAKLRWDCNHALGRSH